MNKAYANAAARIGNKINVASLAVPAAASHHIHLLENKSPPEFIPPHPPKNTYGFNPYGIGGSSSFDGKQYELNIDLVGREITAMDQHMWEEIRQAKSPRNLIDFALDLTINGELNYYKDRFQYDSDFHEAIKSNARSFYLRTDILNRLDYLQAPVTLFTIHMWQLLSQMTIDGTYAFNEREIFEAIKRNHPRDLSSEQHFKNNFKIAEQIDKSTFSIKNIPLSTQVCDFNALDIGEIRQRLLSNDSMIFVNTMEQQIGQRNNVLLLKFGYKHVAFVTMYSRNGYQICRINEQNYKFKSLKKELGL